MENIKYNTPEKLIKYEMNEEEKKYALIADSIISSITPYYKQMDLNKNIDNTYKTIYKKLWIFHDNKK